jgi:uncharacterized membrane protein
MLALLCAALEGFGQIFLKRSVLPGGRPLGWIALGVVLFVLQGLLYAGALAFIEVSAAFPISSVSLVVAALLSRLVLDEAMSQVRWLGVALIVVGTTLIAASA